MRFKDQVSKEVVETLIIDIAKYILGIEIKKFEFLDKESQRIESRRADVVVKVNDEFILHMEIQNANDKSMPIRMLRYLGDIMLKNLKNKIDLPIKQYLIYIGKPKLSMKDGITKDGLNYKYNLIDIRKINCETLLKIDNPDALVLAILCDFKDKNKQEVVNTILLKLQEISKDENSFKNNLEILTIFSTNRNLEKNIKKGVVMLRELELEKNPLYQIGFEKGLLIAQETEFEKGKITQEFLMQKGKLQGKIELLKDMNFTIDEIAYKLKIPKEQVIKLLKD